jgi:hypothetical protein
MKAFDYFIIGAAALALMGYIVPIAVGDKVSPIVAAVWPIIVVMQQLANRVFLALSLLLLATACGERDITPEWRYRAVCYANGDTIFVADSLIEAIPPRDYVLSPDHPWVFYRGGRLVRKVALTMVGTQVTRVTGSCVVEKYWP